jgi:hypothetical protein
MYSAVVRIGLVGFNFQTLPIKLLTSVIIEYYMRIKFKKIFI